VAPAIVTLMDLPPENAPPHEIYNLGNSKPTIVLDLVSTIEKATGVKANVELAPPRKTEVTATFADHSRATARFGFAPKTTIDDGIPRFVEWYKRYCGYTERTGRSARA
jgi:UDP-glucuronate 4-epimerase